MDSTPGRAGTAKNDARGRAQGAEDGGEPSFAPLRYFSIAALIAIALAIVLLGGLCHEFAVRDLHEMGERHNVALTRAFANVVWPRYGDFLSRTADLDAEALRTHPRIAQLNADVRSHMRGTSVAKVKIYDLAGRTVYSSDARQISSWAL